SLEDFYDEERGKGSFRDFYEEVCRAAEEGKLRSTLWKKVRAIDLMKKILVSQFETGYPYIFYRDEANRMNPNKHMGMIYSSNLCTEIHQNMSPTYVVEEVLT
ncbi:ribonucleoside-diphosphate reductase subunit alpha, partial [Listeria monocytogenes]